MTISTSVKTVIGTLTAKPCVGPNFPSIDICLDNTVIATVECRQLDPKNPVLFTIAYKNLNMSDTESTTTIVEV